MEKALSYSERKIWEAARCPKVSLGASFSRDIRCTASDDAVILDDIQDAAERQGEEMLIEGIDAIDHWAHELGISYEELYFFIEARAREIYNLGREEGVRLALMSGWMDGFIKGYIARERNRVGPT